METQDPQSLLNEEVVLREEKRRSGSELMKVTRSNENRICRRARAESARSSTWAIKRKRSSPETYVGMKMAEWTGGKSDVRQD